MKHRILITVLALGLGAGPALAASPAVEQLLQDYAAQGATSPDAEAGRRMWQQTFTREGEFPQRSCAACHTKDLSATGRHVKTRKAIKPMSPAANPKRLTDVKKIEKWFRRNCRWTLGRECTAREKADFLAYINASS